MNVQPQTCSIKGWVVWAPGYHKGKPYSVEASQRMPKNFAYLKGSTLPKLRVDGGTKETKLGHDGEQFIRERLRRSAGGLAFGTITRCEEVPGWPGYNEIDVDGLPVRLVGGELNAGRLHGGSVEILNQEPDPRDPGRTIEGPILKGISLLGEEHPAIRNFPPELQERAIPKATFPDGSMVPANPEPPQEWLEATAAYNAHLMSELVANRVYADDGIVSYAFSDMYADGKQNEGASMNPEMERKMMGIPGMSKEMAAACMACMAGGDAAVSPAPTGAAAPMVTAPAPATGSGGPVGGGGGDMEPMSAKFSKMSESMTDPNMKMMATAFASLFSSNEEMTKRVGALDKMAEDASKAGEAAQMASFSAEIDHLLNGTMKDEGGKRVHVVEHRELPYKILPVERPRIKQALLAMYAPNLKTFSSDADRTAGLNAILDGYARLPVNKALAQAPPTTPAVGSDGKPPEVKVNGHTPHLSGMLRKGSVLDRSDMSGVTARLRNRIASA
jgi:hypothetical protein